MGILMIVALHKEAVYLIATTASIGDVVGAFEQEACRERGRKRERERERERERGWESRCTASEYFSPYLRRFNLLS